tara:strand:+ start:9433 stop:9924 length:492 start_codon:yes stop_codon:yes gene_type:complete
MAASKTRRIKVAKKTINKPKKGKGKKTLRRKSGGGFFGPSKKQRETKGWNALKPWISKELGKTIWVEDKFFDELSPADQEKRRQKWEERETELKNASLEKLKVIREDARSSLYELVEIHNTNGLLTQNQIDTYYDTWRKEIEKFIIDTLGQIIYDKYDKHQNK